MSAKTRARPSTRLGSMACTGIVDDHKPERAFVERRPRQEQGEGKAVEFALAHDAEGDSFNAVDRHVDVESTGGRGTAQHEVAKFDVGVEAEL